MFSGNPKLSMAGRESHRRDPARGRAQVRAGQASAAARAQWPPAAAAAARAGLLPVNARE